MASVNKAIILGNVGQDPTVRSLSSGGSVASFSIATTDKFKDKQGNAVEKTEWHNIISFGKTADIIAQYVKKGSQLYVEGKLQTSSWEDKNGGGKKYKTEIIMSSFQFLGGKTDKGANKPAPQNKPQPTPHSTGIDEDLPF